MKKIALTQGKFALVDDEDYERLAWFQWYAYRSENGVWYARRNAGPEGARKTISMHRAVLGLIELDPDVDHRDLDGLNNQKSNLRRTRQNGNSANINVRRDNKSGMKGVYWSARHNRWSAQITTKGKQRWLGYHKTREDAARAFDLAAIKYHGEFARTNFPREQYP